MTNKMINVLVVDDHQLVRAGTRAILQEADGIRVVGEAASAPTALTQVAALSPDVVLIDIMLMEIEATEAIQEIGARQPQVRSLVFASLLDERKITSALAAGAMGYLLKDTDARRLTQAIRQVYNGEIYLDPRIGRQFLRTLVNGPAPGVPTQLTVREVQVLRCMAQGLSNQEIAERLSIADVTVRTHVSHIFDKLQLANRVQAALYALREGLVSLDVPQA